MRTKIVILAIGLIFGGILVSYAQYNEGYWQKNPPSLYPQAGPGDLMIVDQLKETNRLLEQQNTLIGEQNTLVKTLLAQSAAAAKKTTRK